MSMIAVGEPGRLLTLPDMYMRKLAVGPRARGSIDLLRPIVENIEAIADAFGRRVNDVTTIVLDRPRHHDLIEEIRNAGARIKLIQDGDVTASISAAIRGTNDHLAIGIGGTRQAVLSAAALRCLGGELQAQFWPTSRSEIDAAARDRDRGLHADLPHGGSRARRDDRRGDGRLERRSPARRPLPRRQRADALAADVHPLQLGALRRRHPLLRARAARGSAAARLLTTAASRLGRRLDLLRAVAGDQMPVELAEHRLLVAQRVGCTNGQRVWNRQPPAGSPGSAGRR